MTSNAANVPSDRGAREARYAEALAEYADLDGVGLDFTGYARAVVAVADVEQAELRAEVAEAQAERDNTRALLRSENETICIPTLAQNPNDCSKHDHAHISAEGNE